MIPLRDTIPSASLAVVTYTLIVVNVAVFLYEQSLGSAAEALLYTYGLVPSRLTTGELAVAPLFTSMFLHGGWMHLIGNMLYLHIFGDNVEDHLGHGRFLALYAASGVVSGIAQVATNPASDLPMVGASGAIAGVSGAYFIFFPRARIVTLVPVFVFLQIIEIPAVFFLFMWFAYQLLLGIGTFGSDVGGIAFWAHIGGFVAGVILAPLMAISRPRQPVRPAW